jgi:hypothetical protein
MLTTIRKNVKKTTEMLWESVEKGDDETLMDLLDASKHEILPNLNAKYT